jgi:hypothetical protein
MGESWLKRMKLLDELNSVQLWHHKISNHKIEPKHLKYFQCYGFIARLDDPVTLLA